MFISGLQIIVNQHLSRNQAISGDGCVFLSRFAASSLIFETKGDYNEVFSFVGVNDEAIDACIHEARKRLDIIINT